MSFEPSDQRLKSLREEISQGFGSSPSTELHHAFMIAVGKNLSSTELRHQWERFTQRNFFSPPFLLTTFRRDIRWQSVEGCYFGVIGTIEFNRFKSQAAESLPLALGTLAERGVDLGPFPKQLNGWTFLCYCLAWIYPDRLTYSIEKFELFDKFGLGRESPFNSRKLFESWELSSNAVDFENGLYFAKLSRDIRSCSVSAIEAILALGSNPKRSSLTAHPLGDSSYIELNEKIFKVKYATAIFIDELVKANGNQVSFKELQGKRPELQGEVVTRLLNELPQGVRDLLEGHKGKPYRLRVEALR